MEDIIIGICDDDKAFRLEMGLNIEYILEDEVINGKIVYFTDCKEVLTYNQKLDILLLDEEMENISGTEVKSILSLRHIETAIIYVTSHDEIINHAFGRNVYGFITKPVDAKILREKIKTVIDQLDDSNIIMYIKSESQYIRCFFVSGETIIKKASLLATLDKIDNPNIIRCHRSWAVNMHYIAEIHGAFNEFKMINGEQIPISRYKRENIKEIYSNFKHKKMKIILGEQL